MLTSGTPLGAVSTTGRCAPGALRSPAICACSGALASMATTAARRSATPLPAVARLVPRPVLSAVSCTTMRRPRAALKMIRWKFLFMGWPSLGAQKL